MFFEFVFIVVYFIDGKMHIYELNNLGVGQIYVCPGEDQHRIKIDIYRPQSSRMSPSSSYLYLR